MPAKTATRKPTADEIAQQAADAYAMRQQGQSFAKIGEALGFSDATARARVKVAEETIAAAQAKKAAKSKPAKAKAAPKPQGDEAKWDAKTLKRVVALRDDELSWAKIAAELNLGSPGTARRAWRAATGHTGALPRLEGKGGRVAEAADN